MNKGMRLLLAVGYLATILLGSLCPMQTASAKALIHEEPRYEEIAMSPLLRMTPMGLMSVAPARQRVIGMPLAASWKCVTGHCITADRSDQRSLAARGFALKLIESPSRLLTPVPSFLTLDALPAPPAKAAGAVLAQSISTIVLRV